MAAAVVAALGEQVREQWGGEEEPWRAEVPESVAGLAERTGGSENEVLAALRLLLETNVLASVHAAGRRHLRLGEDAFEELPALARLDGPAVRRRLESVGASVAPALAVVREFAVLSGGYSDVTQPGPWIGASLAHLSETTFFKRTAVSNALRDLDTARLVERSMRAGRQHGYRLLPTAFGAEPPAEVEHRTHAPETRASAPAGEAPVRFAPGLAAPQTGVVLEIGGTRVRVAPGLECALELDSSGTPLLRVVPVSGD